MNVKMSLGLALCFSVLFAGAFASAEPIGIDSIEELQLIGNDVGYPLNGAYVLTQDIDATGTETWDEGKGFRPIKSFIGIFDGQMHTIRNLVIHRPDEDYVGLFGSIQARDSRIENMGVEGGLIVGRSYTGGLAGFSSGHVVKCYTRITVMGIENCGGVVGKSYNDVSLSCAMGSVSGNAYVGGLVGKNGDSWTFQPSQWADITSCFATGPVLCLSWTGGGLVGYNCGGIYKSHAAGTIVGAGHGLAGGNFSAWWDGYIKSDDDSAEGNIPEEGEYLPLEGQEPYEDPRWPDAVMVDSFWCTDISGSSGGVTLLQMLQSATFIAKSWDYENVWAQTDGVTIPHFKWLTAESSIDVTIEKRGLGVVEPAGGSFPAWSVQSVTAIPAESYVFAGWSVPAIERNGILKSVNSLLFVIGGADLMTAIFTPDSIPVETLDELSKIGNDPEYPLSGRYALMSDLDASITASLYNGTGFRPIGIYNYPFAGVFDGQGHRITGLTINRPGEKGVGLFGYTSETVEIRNLGIEDASITGNYEVGGLVGVNGGEISQCYTTGSVKGAYANVPWFKYEPPTNYSKCYIGGLAGVNAGVIENCYSMAEVQGNRTDPDYGNPCTDGLAGTRGAMRKCYWTGPVSIPKDSVNPDKSDPLDEDCYWNAEIIGIPSTYGVSKTTSEMKQQVTYVGWDFETVWALNALTNQGYPYLQVFLSNEGQPPDGDIPPDGDTPPDGQEPTEGDTPPDGQTPISTPLEGESTIADGETATDDAKPQTMVFSCNTV